VDWFYLKAGPKPAPSPVNSRHHNLCVLFREFFIFYLKFNFSSLFAAWCIGFVHTHTLTHAPTHTHTHKHTPEVLYIVQLVPIDTKCEIGRNSLNNCYEEHSCGSYYEHSRTPVEPRKYSFAKNSPKFRESLRRMKVLSVHVLYVTHTHTHRDTHAFTPLTQCCAHTCT